MKKLLLLGLPILALLFGLPVLAALTITMSSQAAAECRPPADSPVADGDVAAQLTQLSFADGYPTMTAAQARNAITIAQVAHELRVPRDGLQVAIATAIQESKLVNLAGGDADSGGLFQQRPSAGWGTRSQVTNPTLAAEAFFGRARHTDNTGLLDIPGWQNLPLTVAAQQVQHSGYPDAYAQWETVAGDITDLLGGDLPDVGDLDPACPPVDTSTCPPTGSPAEQGLTPDARLMLRSIDARFGPNTYLGVGERSTNPDSDHPSGRAVDIMIDNWRHRPGVEHGGQIAEWVRAHAHELGVTYVIWRAKIWATGDTDWRPYRHPSGSGDPTSLHMDHVHVSVSGNRATLDCSAAKVVYPVPAPYVDTDAHNWHDSGGSWDSWHTGTDFGAPCGTPVLAAHAGTIEIDTTQAWAGPYLVEVTTGPNALTTWYAHMSQVTVSRGQTVNAGDQIGQVGDEGNSDGCHLHFEVHERGGSIYGPDNVDPSTWLAEHVRGPQ
jgi:peptidase M23-like protein